MFKNRSLIVKMAKDVEPNEAKPEDKISWGAHVSVLMEEAVKGGAILIGAYMAADTLRKCIIHTVATKVQ